jgi:hypothetical protein
MMPPEFYQVLAHIQDHLRENPQPPTIGLRVKSLLFTALLIFLVLGFVLAVLFQEVLPWLSWLNNIWE